MGKNKKGSLTNVSTVHETVILENNVKPIEKLLDSGSNIPSELDTVVTTENVVEVLVTENVVEVTATENVVEVTATENVGEVTATENVVEVTVTENVGEVTRTENALIENGINSVEKKDELEVDSVNKSCNRRLCSML